MRFEEALYMKSSQAEFFFDPCKRKLCQSATLFVNHLCFPRFHFQFEGCYWCWFGAVCDDTASARVVWTAVLAVQTRAAVGSARLIEPIFAAVRQFIGFTEFQQFVRWTDVVILLGIIAKRVPLKFGMNTSPIRLSSFFPAGPGFHEP